MPSRSIPRSLTPSSRGELSPSCHTSCHICHCRVHDERVDMAGRCVAKDEEIMAVRRSFQAAEEKIVLLEERHEKLVEENITLKGVKETWFPGWLKDRAEGQEDLPAWVAMLVLTWPCILFYCDESRERTSCSLFRIIMFIMFIMFIMTSCSLFRIACPDISPAL